MAELKARFSLIDEMSDRLSSIADKGQEVMNNWEQAGNSASSAMDAVTSSASNAVSTVDGVAKSLDDLSSTANSAGANADSLSEAMNSVGNSIDNAAAETDNWTSAVGSYNKEALEMVYTTEELVEMGYKTADALGNQEEMYALCEQSAAQLNSQMENAVNSHEQLSDAIEKTNEVMERLTDSEKLSAESQEQLESASKAAAQAMQELESAQAEAQAAMDNYDAVIISGTNDLGELESAAQRASAAAENLASAQDKATKATEEYSNATDNAAQSAEESGTKGVDAITAIAETVIAAKIAEKVYEIANAAYELADAYSDAQEIVVNATGATGNALDGLEQSMMNAYAGHNQDLNTTAGAIGEINTRMALTGDELTEVTGLFLDYSRITGSDVVGSVQNVTKVMNQWGVEGKDVESILDRLAYAGQISGASVDSLSQTLITGAASFQEVGLSLDSTIQLLADFELAGINGSTAITAMRTAVNNFTNDGKNAETELQNVIAKIASMEDSTEATALAVDTFGTRAGQQLASAIRNGTVSIDSFNASLESADGTLQRTAKAGETLGEKWEKSNNKIKAAFTSALQPTIDKFSSGFAKVMDNVGDFLNKHPVVTKAIVAIGTGLGVAAVAIAGVTFAVTVAIPAITAFGVSIQAALGPIGWISLGATALVGGIFALTSAFSKSEDQVADYNGTMEECANEISRTEAAYDKACELYGENSAAAQELAENLETLNAQFEKGGGAGAVYVEQAEKLSQAFDELSASQKKAMEEIDKTETSGLNAVAMLSALSEQSTYTNADLDLMSEYADYLNDTFNCNIVVDYNTKELTGFNPTVLTETVLKAAADERYQKAMEVLSGAGLQDNYIEAKKQVTELNKRMDELVQLTSEVNMIDYDGPLTNKDITDEMDGIRDALAVYEPMLEDATAQIQEYGAKIDETGAFTENFMKTLDGLAFGTDEATTATEKNTSALTDEEQGIIAASEAWGEYQERIEELCVAYDEVYQAALESFQGQFGLFEQASMQSETYLNSTVANAQAALDSQLAYWTEYSSNIEVLKNISAEDLGITQENYDALMSRVQSGNEEAAGLAASMVKEIENGHTESVTELANTLGDVTAKQEEIAATTADWITGFSEQINSFALDMTSTIVNDLDLSDEAKSSGFNTIVSYALAITNNGGKAVEAAQSIADRVSAALASANTSINVGVSGSVPGHATGTTNAEDVFVAGENGPELIVGKAGSTVFPNSETNKIISALHDVGGASYSNSYTTENAIADNSAVNHYNSAYENYNQTESTEIFNNYTNVENGSSYDDSAIIHYLDSFVSICSAIEREISNEETQASETSAEIPEITTIVDLSVLDEMITKYRSSGDVSNLDESVTYGDTQNIDNSRSYSTEYGDNDLSKTSTEITNYGDVAQSIENSHRYGDRDYETSTSYNAETNLSTSAESVINDVNDNIVEYGDMIRSYNDVQNYGDTVKRNDSSEQTDISKSWDVTYSSDNSRGYEVLTNYGDTVRSYEESVRGNDSYYNAVTSYDNEQSYTASADTSYGDTFGSESNYGDVIRNATEANSNSSDNSYTETVNYGDVVKSLIENVTGGTEQRYNTSNTASNSSEQSYYNSVGEKSYLSEENANYGNTLDSAIIYGDTIRTITDNVEGKYEENNNSSNSSFNSRAESYYNSIGDRTVGAVTGPTYRSDLSYDSDYSRTIRNIDQNETNSSLNSLQRNESTLYQNDLSNNAHTDNLISNYGNTFESVENAFESVSNIIKSTSLTNSADSHSDSVSVLSEAINNNSVANSRYEQALTNLSNDFDTNASSVEQATSNVENITNGDIFNNAETSLSTSAESLTGDSISSIINNGDKTVDYGGDNFKYNYITDYQSEAYYSNSDGSQSVSNSFISNAATTVAEYGDSRYNYDTISDNSVFTDSRNYNAVDTKSGLNSFYYGNSSNNVIDSATDYENSTIYSNTSNNDYNGDNSVFTDSRLYEVMTNSSSASHTEYVTNSNGDAIETATTYGDSINSIEKNYNNSTNSSQTFENGVTSVFIPMLEIITKMLESSFKGNFSEIERYYSSTERFEADPAELVSPEIVIDSSYLTALESENRIIAETNEDSPMKIPPPEPNDSDEKDNGKDGDTRRIVIEIAGSGSIDISNSVDREQVLELLQENLKPVLMNIISSEIYEEGELSYDF